MPAVWRIIVRVAWLVLLMALVAAPDACRAAEPRDIEQLQIHQLQYVGTLNSYHVRDVNKAKPGVKEWNYNHAPLDVQLDRGVRSFELDLHDRKGEFEVFHVPIMDEGTTCRRLSDALQTERKWSDAHPRHVPISFLFELKKEGPRLDRSINAVDSAGMDRLDAELNAVFGPERRISPDDVRGTSETLREAVRTRGWPTLAASRGKVLFILHDNGAQREIYATGHPSLRGRVMFVRSDADRDDGATLVLDDPRATEIPDMVRAGYFVRTRADSDLLANPASQPGRRDAAFASGAQILSTDFPAGEKEAKTGYSVEFADGAPARVNPVNAPVALQGLAVPE